MRIMKLDISELLFGDDFDLVNKGAIAEQFIGLEVMKHSSCYRQEGLFYWHREALNSNAEIDYLVSVYKVGHLALYVEILRDFSPLPKDRDGGEKLLNSDIMDRHFCGVFDGVELMLFPAGKDLREIATLKRIPVLLNQILRYFSPGIFQIVRIRFGKPLQAEHQHFQFIAF